MSGLSRNRKAVSSVIGTILMILVVVIGMSMAFGYFVNFVKDYQAGRGASVMELISVEDVWFKVGGNNVEMWLYNYGKVGVKMSTFYVDGRQVSLNSVDVPVGGHVPVTVQTQWLPGVTYHFKLVTDRGSVFEGDYASSSI
ncbi:MAG: archaellin/type IV pilin N-terminal domain-containing protein [Candidatus Bathyarchaeia archaeon]|jgi:flagellin-like protein